MFDAIRPSLACLELTDVYSSSRLSTTQAFELYDPYSNPPSPDAAAATHCASTFTTANGFLLPPLPSVHAKPSKRKSDRLRGPGEAKEKNAKLRTKLSEIQVKTNVRHARRKSGRAGLAVAEQGQAFEVSEDYISDIKDSTGERDEEDDSYEGPFSLELPKSSTVRVSPF